MDSHFKVAHGNMGASLIPADEETNQRLLKAKHGDVYRCTVKRQRNYQFLKKAHALINLAFDCQEAYEDKEEFRKAVTIQAGHTDIIKNMNGDRIEVAASWSFEKMTEEEFGELYSDMISAMVQYAELFNGMSRNDWVNALGEFS